MADSDDTTVGQTPAARKAQRQAEREARRAKNQAERAARKEARQGRKGKVEPAEPAGTVADSPSVSKGAAAAGPGLAPDAVARSAAAAEGASGPDPADTTTAPKRRKAPRKPAASASTTADRPTATSKSSVTAGKPVKRASRASTSAPAKASPQDGKRKATAAANAASRAPGQAVAAGEGIVTPAGPTGGAVKGKAPAAKTRTRAASRKTPARDFDILIVAQGGGIDREAAILAASLRRNAPGFAGRLVVAEPQPEGAWAGHDPRMSGAARDALTALGADIRPLVAQDFGAGYPHGNKIEALGLLEPGRPFLFLDSDTLILGDIGSVPFDFGRPSASMRREGTWPEPPAYRHTYDSIWRSLYDRFGLDMDGSLDPSQPEEHWKRFLYFNAGWFFGADPAEFGRRFRDWAVAVRDDPGEALACQSLDPWLDQVILPLVIHSLGGGRPGAELAGMDGAVTCHYRNLPLLYARGPDAAIAEIEAIAALPEIAPLLDGWEPAERLIRDGLGRRRIRPMFAAGVPAQEKAVRQRLKAAELWLD